MTNYSVIEKAVELVVYTLELDNKAEQSDTIRARVESWYNNTDITDPEVLAGCALTGKSYFKGASYNWMLQARDWWFPQPPVEMTNFAVWEIETAIHDMLDTLFED